MPFLPTFNDLKSVGSSFNPLNLFSDPPKGPNDEERLGEAGPGPSSLANRGASLKSDTSSSDSFDGEDGRRKSNAQGVSIQADERPKREKKKKVPMDSYIIVKPPPTNSKNALNLQIQLVVGKGGRGRSDSTGTSHTGPRTPSASVEPYFPRLGGPSTPPASAGSRITLGPVINGSSSKPIEGLERRSDTPPSEDDPSPLPSATLSAGTNGTVLRRINSRKSSSSSIPLSMNSASGQKRIQPMFNLNVHNVMHASVVTDAGTDAKVAKFGKRNIDIVDVGILEPTEIWQVAANSSTLFPPGATLEESRSRPMSMHSLTFPLSPTSTRLADDGRVRTSIDILRPETIQEGGASAKRFFGKIGGAFKKKNAGDKEGGQGLVPGPSPTPNTGAFPSSSSMARGGSKDGGADYGVAIGPPTFGCSPSVIARRASAAALPSDSLAPPDSAPLAFSTPRNTHASNRPVAYSWTVKKWCKRNTDGWAANLVEAVANGVSMQGGTGVEAEDEVMFEWTKARGPSVTVTPRSRRSSFASKGHSRPPSTAPGMDSPSARASMRDAPLAAPLPGTPTLSARPQPTRRISAASSLSPHKAEPTIPDDSSIIYQTAEEDDSDPEDSETPWTCSLVVKRTGQRQVLGTLTPAPHHPKVVGQLKLPSRLETICLAQVAGSGVHVEKAKKEVSLSEEAVKDVVCVTALWLVAREGWNGLGKIKRGR